MSGRRTSPSPKAPAPLATAGPIARWELVALVLVVAATLAVYWPVRSFEFVNYDDNQFIFDNPRMQEGLSLRNAGWAFTVAIAANWHPLTTLTHLIDCSVFHLDAGGHHLTSLLIHLLNVVLLYLLLRRLTVSAGAGLLVAALFALHPVNVESVAWISERKNVLSQLFFFLTLWAYADYARSGSRRSFAVALALFAAGLMSKAMLVSVPAVLLLLDLWPLGRASLASARTALRDLVRLLPEKLPFVALSLAASVLTVVTQREVDALPDLRHFPLATRLANAAVSYLAYVGDLFAPVHLAVCYQVVGIEAWRSLGAAALLVAASAVAWLQRLRRPYLLVGWAWYLVTLVPVIGVVQVGSQARADRYAYLPLIGLFLVLALLAEEAAGWLRAPRTALWAAAGVLLLGLAPVTRRQVLVWHDDQALWQHALGSVKGAYVAYNGLGMLHAKQHKLAEAAKDFEAAVAINPEYYDAWNNLGQVKLEQNDLEAAVGYYRKALRYKRSSPKALNNLGTCLARQGHFTEAAGFYEEALGLDPEYVNARSNYARALSALGRADEANVQLQKVEESRRRAEQRGAR